MLEISELFPLPTFPQTPSRFPFRRRNRSEGIRLWRNQVTSPSAAWRRCSSGSAGRPSPFDAPPPRRAPVWSRTARRLSSPRLSRCSSAAAGTAPGSGSGGSSGMRRRIRGCDWRREENVRTHLQAGDGHGRLSQRLHRQRQQSQAEPHGVKDGDGGEGLRRKTSAWADSQTGRTPLPLHSRLRRWAPDPSACAPGRSPRWPSWGRCWWRWCSCSGRSWTDESASSPFSSTLEDREDFRNECAQKMKINWSFKLENVFLSCSGLEFPFESQTIFKFIY